MNENVKNWNEIRMNASLNPYDTKTVNDFLTACVRSVLKTVYDPKRHTRKDEEVNTVDKSGCNERILKLRQSMSADCARLENSREWVKPVSEWDKKLLMSVPVGGKATNEAFNSFLTPLDDGQDLISVAWIAYLEERAKAEKNSDFNTFDWMESVYTYKKVLRGGKLEKPTEKEVETSAVKEIFRAIRKAVRSERHDEYGWKASEKPYIEDIDGGKIYTYVPDIDKTTHKEVKQYIEEMNLNDRQKSVLRYLLMHKSAYQYAKDFELSYKNVLRTVHQIKERARKVGLTEDILLIIIAEKSFDDDYVNFNSIIGKRPFED